ncbi:hypothetical protein Pst134EA_015994 [Puccinia striiformis f. sp. tritici]|uniref:hypothetical protein n=1 Tax=Puccinia striiformis f. sp. tritici TaxID=168172 RepID=UPI0020085782|nr:hypothetical protein Pst134EA_015994 [Puccinia striiformis f. sp. tritici]KAH9453124.1 hypothetical protein Pst134EB_017057 [Puccinia striiformis f. sp. tritici]KAH9463913.1 hypothetical protein Pst134EA_015994 [Puccinia striiformis f. sp. tritici]
MSKPETLAKQVLRHQAELVIKRFGSLANYDFLGSATTPTDLSIARLCTKQDIFTEVHSSLLPLLQQQVSIISQALRDPDKLRRDPGPTIRLILKLQPDLEQTLDQTIRAINDIIPGTLPKPDQMNDQNFGEFKCYRLRGLNDAIRRGMKTQIIRFFSDCKRFIERLQLPRDGQQTDVEVSSFALVVSIHVVITWATGSELNLICGRWQDGVREVDGASRDLLSLVDPENEDVREEIVLLAKSFIPITKLTQLFFAKLSREGMLKNRALLGTQMSSYQLDLLETSADKIGDGLFNIVYRLEEPEDHELVSPAYLIEQVTDLVAQFQTSSHNAIQACHTHTQTAQ